MAELRTRAVELTEAELRFLASLFVEGAPEHGLSEAGREALAEKLVMAVGRIHGYDPASIAERVRRA